LFSLFLFIFVMLLRFCSYILIFLLGFLALAVVFSTLVRLLGLLAGIECPRLSRWWRGCSSGGKGLKCRERKKLRREQERRERKNG